MTGEAIDNPKRMRISLRAVSASERSKEIGQPLFYTVFLADGLSVASNSENIEGMSRLTSQLGIELSSFSEICGNAERWRNVSSLDLGDRKLFITPAAKDEVETRSITKELLGYARLERISALSFTNFSCYGGDFPEDQLRWILETMRDFDAADGPYRLWFEISPEHFPKLLALRQEIFARTKLNPTQTMQFPDSKNQEVVVSSSFETELLSLRQLTKNRDEFKFKRGQDLAEEISRAKVSEKYGVYLLWGCATESDPGSLLYIGMSGTIRQDGKLSDQGLSQRLRKKQDGKSRQKLFEELLSGDDERVRELDHLRVAWFETYGGDKEICPPFLAEAKLLAAYLSDTGKLPPLNKKA